MDLQNHIHMCYWTDNFLWWQKVLTIFITFVLLKMKGFLDSDSIGPRKTIIIYVQFKNKIKYGLRYFRMSLIFINRILQVYNSNSGVVDAFQGTECTRR